MYKNVHTLKEHIEAVRTTPSAWKSGTDRAGYLGWREATTQKRGFEPEEGF
jgi:hypothetical protein